MKNPIDGVHLVKYLIFSRGDSRSYGLEELENIEIVGLMDIIELMPDSSIQVNDGLEVKGKILPLVDLRKKPDCEEGIYDERSCIILMECQHSEERCFMGLVVESICE